MPITIAICDDEKNMAEHLMNLIKSDTQTSTKNLSIDLYSSGDALLAANKDYDICFLDIQMPGLNGVETAEQIRANVKGLTNSIIIFVTALKEYMQDAFDVKAFHYLIKPIDEAKFRNVFFRAISDLEKSKENSDSHIIIKNGNTHHKIFVRDIIYIESHDKKVIINKTDGQIEYYGKINELENTLNSSSFFRCHRCYLVNMEHITRYNANTIWLKNGKDIFLAQKKYQKFVKAYMSFARGDGLIHV